MTIIMSKETRTRGCVSSLEPRRGYKSWCNSAVDETSREWTLTIGPGERHWRSGPGQEPATGKTRNHAG